MFQNSYNSIQFSKKCLPIFKGNSLGPQLQSQLLKQTRLSTISVEKDARFLFTTVHKEKLWPEDKLRYIFPCYSS